MIPGDLTAEREDFNRFTVRSLLLLIAGKEFKPWCLGLYRIHRIDEVDRLGRKCRGQRSESYAVRKEERMRRSESIFIQITRR